ncbi:hypothetical protein [Bradyrhizobium sp. CCBAU 51745]|uniref:hypothetical protein n=1 Tax=Bradyrhizobium sp. CCBAU 51745 TaxID=1325099 RepID=UPI00230586A0|nr:hypothetical protein [Bradyrhizobium sp. CCBAU 51745]
MSVLRDDLGAELIKRRGRHSDLTEFRRLFASEVSDPLETVAFNATTCGCRNQADCLPNVTIDFCFLISDSKSAGVLF